MSFKKEYKLFKLFETLFLPPIIETKIPPLYINLHWRLNASIHGKNSIWHIVSTSKWWMYKMRVRRNKQKLVYSDYL